MGIKIKVKNILIIFFIILTLILSLTILKSQIMILTGNYYKSIDNYEKAETIYNKVLEENERYSSDIRLQISLLECFFKNNNFKYANTSKVSSVFTCSEGKFIEINELNKMNETYKKIILKNNNKYIQEYTYYIALANWFGGRADKAVELLSSEYAPKNGHELYIPSKLNLAAFNLFNGKYYEDMPDFDDIDNEDDILYQIKTGLYAFKAFMEGNNEEFKRLKNEYEKNVNYKQTCNKASLLLFKNLNNILSGCNNMIEANKGIKNNNVLAGRITENGNPVSGAVIMLQDYDEKGRMGSGYFCGREMGINAYGISDEEGNYIIKNIPDGKYGTVIMIESQRVIDKLIDYHDEYDLCFTGNTQYENNIKITEPLSLNADEIIPGKKFKISIDEKTDKTYNIVFHMYSDILSPKEHIFIFSDEISCNEYIIDTEDIMLNKYLFGYGYTANNKYIDPVLFLESFYLPGEYFFNVYDKEKNKIGSRGICILNEKYKIKVTGNEPAYEDELLLECKFDEAIKAYEKKFKEEKDIHAAKVLMKLYNYGWIINDECEIEGRDWVKSIYYAEYVYNKTGNDAVKRLIEKMKK